MDYVVVGGGSAGATLAGRLSENPKNKVCLLEAGGSDWSPMIRVPAASGDLIRRGAYGWSYHTEPEAELKDRTLFWPRGKVMGGSSSINGQVYIRGHRSDYDHWAQLGNRGWSYEDVLPFFLKSEDHLTRKSPLHGQGGPLKVTEGSMQNPLFDAFLSAGEQAGFGRAADLNASEPSGLGRFDFTTAGGRRQSTSRAFLSKRRSNLRIIKHATATGLVIEDGRAVGVKAQVRGQDQVFLAEKEVILCAGVIGSPHLLMLSGIGPSAVLTEHDIPVVQDLTGIGQNLQDHVQIALMYGCKEPITMYQAIRFDRAAMAMIQAVLLRRGVFSEFPVQCGGFTRSSPDLEVPDTQWHFATALGLQRMRFPFVGGGGKFDRDGYTIAPCLLRPRSVGSLSLRSPTPVLAPKIMANYLSHSDDMTFFKRVFHQARFLAQQPAFTPYRDVELAPGSEVKTDDEVEDYVRLSLSSCHHQVGTCKMGPASDSTAVVDDSLRVHGVGNLRVADASIMPTLVGGNTNAATIMIAEKLASMIAS